MKTKALTKIALLTCLFVTFVGCQTAKDADSNSRAVQDTPNTLSQTTSLGEQFTWGGKILSVNPLEDSTELTILSYPLNKQHYPKLRGASTGRFITIHHGYLEPLDYAPGRLITVNGALVELREGSVAEASYQFPVLTSEELKLLAPKKKLPFSVGFSFGF